MPGSDLQLPFPSGSDGVPPPLYDDLRQQCPVSHVRTPAGDNTFLLTRTEDVLYVYENPDGLLWQRLSEDPGCVPVAVEEILRFDAPGQGGIPRLATADVRLPSGAVIPAGSAVVAPLIVQGIDPDVFPDPRRFDIERAAASRHIAFGAGEHYCIGAPLVRAELQEVFTILPQRLPGLRLADVPEPVVWTDPTLKVSGPSKLLVEW